jgi:hypothetical protein
MTVEVSAFEKVLTISSVSASTQATRIMSPFLPRVLLNFLEQFRQKHFQVARGHAQHYSMFQWSGNHCCDNLGWWHQTKAWPKILLDRF